MSTNQRVTLTGASAGTGGNSVGSENRFFRCRLQSNCSQRHVRTARGDNSALNSSYLMLQVCMCERKYSIYSSVSYKSEVVDIAVCDQILENSSKSHIKSSVFLHVFNDIFTYVHVFTEYFLHSFSNLSIEFLVVL